MIYYLHVSNTAAAAVAVAVVACLYIGQAIVVPVVGILAGLEPRCVTAAVLDQSLHGPGHILVREPGPVRIRSALVLVHVRISVPQEDTPVLAQVLAQASAVLPEDIPVLAALSSAHGLLLPVHILVLVLVLAPVGVPASMLTQGPGEQSLWYSDRGETGAHDRCPSTGPHKTHTAAALAPCPAAPVNYAAQHQVCLSQCINNALVDDFQTFAKIIVHNTLQIFCPDDCKHLPQIFSGFGKTAQKIYWGISLAQPLMKNM